MKIQAYLTAAINLKRLGAAAVLALFARWMACGSLAQLPSKTADGAVDAIHELAVI
jgi:hypothetical protein